MKHASSLSILAVAAGLCAPAAIAQAAPQPRAVVELFTSQGCSSCPPADKLMAEFAQDPTLVAVSMPIDYWDYLGWKDTLADHAFTSRQRGYGEQRGDRQVYTPQAVVDGVAHAIGSDPGAVAQAEAASRLKGAMTVPVSVEAAAGTIRISVGAGAADAEAGVYLVPVRKRCDVSITRGENKGKAVTYVNVARSVLPVGAWKGQAATFDVAATLAQTRDADSYVVLLQTGTIGRPGVILGAAKGPGL
ncbi:hypothetical protein GCM10007036_40160 [Alsobacter metallidurans]|uniref:DUF1223 domain-containing protein n=1 Tax=Alsobacter metallidurans TaxID=340221 RepID=A0A917IBI6_9HYPH|nr:DUF1223 domain-containing protein [Alsobacter metallidurans]GGH29915.1 hypothetical protein GCM10007036_40160 [Alsobacter metallidurans]